MHEIYKQRLAEQDLIDIWLYSFENWDIDQADLYLDQLEAGITQLSNNPELGVACDHIRPGYRCYHVRHHMIYYRIELNRINVIRVLHEQMLPERHL